MTDQNPLAETERFLHEKIPLSLAMAVRVESHTADALVLTAPPGPNHNHLGTAFGGSLGAIALLAGYGLLWLEIDDPDCHIVVRSSALDYRRPVRGQLRAVCRKPAEAEMAQLRETFRRKGKARIHLQVHIVEDEELCVAFEGVFVVLRGSAHPGLGTLKAEGTEKNPGGRP